jgi:ribosome maturation factor RimP
VQELIDKTDALETVRRIAQTVVGDRGLDLVDVELAGGQRGGVVRVFIDKRGGIDVTDLQRVSEEVSVILDAEDPIRGRYTLEVSSPGLDRPLRTGADFRRALGELVHLTAREPLAGRSEWTGRVVSVESEEAITLESTPASTAPPLRIPLAAIARARIEVAFPKVPQGRRARKRQRARKAHG